MSVRSSHTCPAYLMKCVAFVDRNTDFPFPVKHRVMNAAFLQQYCEVAKQHKACNAGGAQYSGAVPPLSHTGATYYM